LDPLFAELAFLHILAGGHPVINAQLHGLVTPERAAAPVRRVGPRAFWILFAVEGLLLAAALLVMLNLLLPTRAPLTRGSDVLIVRDAIWDRLNGAAADPLIQIAPGANARASAVRGFVLDGQTYYYYVEGRRGFDPLSRGAVDAASIEVLLRDEGGPATLVIYRLL
jgi:hypothetical protein